MGNDDTSPDDEAESTGEFYVPATFQFSREPGRAERVLVGLFDEDGELEVRRVSEDSTPEFYVPAMFQFSKGPGRIERFLQALFDEEEAAESAEIPEEFRDDFYLPGANPDEFRRPKE